VNVGTSTKSVALTITTASVLGKTRPVIGFTMFGTIILGLALVPAGFRQGSRRRRLLVALFLAVSFAGCGGLGSGSGSGSVSSQPIHATVDVTASAANATSGTTMVSLTIN
jgi:hypothetical protein